MYKAYKDAADTSGVLTPITGNRKQQRVDRAATAKPIAIVDAAPTALLDALHDAEAGTPEPTDADAAAAPLASEASPTARPSNQWNAFQRVVGKKGFSKPQMCDMYSLIKMAQQQQAHGSARGFVTWNGFQKHCGGKGYSKEQVSKMYYSCKTAERFFFEEAASAAK
jgi:hypothetical protein